jgi:hypothetical protein
MTYKTVRSKVRWYVKQICLNFITQQYWYRDCIRGNHEDIHIGLLAKSVPTIHGFFAVCNRNVKHILLQNYCYSMLDAYQYYRNSLDTDTWNHQYTVWFWKLHLVVC